MPGPSLQKLQETVIEWTGETALSATMTGRKLKQELSAINSIRWDEDTGTAVMIGQPGRGRHMKINPNFFQKHVLHAETSRPNLGFLFYHETAHSLRSDFTRAVRGLDKTWNYLANIVCDIYVNSYLYRGGFPPVETITSSLYSTHDARFLLLPPHYLIRRLDPGGENKKIPRGMESILQHPEVLWCLFGNERIAEMREAFPVDGENPGLPPKTKVIPYLIELFLPPLRTRVEGEIKWKRNQKDNVRELLTLYLNAWLGGIPLEEFSRRLAGLVNVNRLAYKLTPCSCANDREKARGTNQGEDSRVPPYNATKVKQFARILRNALVRSNITDRFQQKRVQQPGVIPGTDRRSSYLMAGGTWPVFFNNDFNARRPARETCYLYLDSSTSMEDHVVSVVSSLITQTGEWISEPVYMFTVDVEPVSLDEINEGKRRTGGTKISPVLEHAKDQDLDKFLVITDGAVEQLNSEQEQFLNHSEMYVVFEGEAGSPLKSHAEKYWEHFIDKLC